MKLRFCSSIVTAITIIICMGKGLASDALADKIDKTTALYALQLRLDAATRAGFTSGDKRSQLNPFFLEILMDFASTNVTDVARIKHQNSTFENLMLWLASPPNAEALIGVNEILHTSHDDWLRSQCLAFLSRLDDKRRLDFPVQGGLVRLRDYFTRTSPAVPLVSQLMAKAMAQHGDAAGKELLLMTLRKPEESQHRRIECARALLYIDVKCAEALQVINDHLTDDSVPEIEKTKTKEVLFDVGDERGKVWMLGLLSSTNANQVCFASRVLMRNGDARGLTKAASLLQNPDGDISRIAGQLLEMYAPNVSVDNLDLTRVKWNSQKDRFEMSTQP